MKTVQALNLINERIALDKKLVDGDRLPSHIIVLVHQDLEIHEWVARVLSDSDKPSGFDDLLTSDFGDLVARSNDYWQKNFTSSEYDMELLNTTLALRAGMASRLFDALSRAAG